VIIVMEERLRVGGMIADKRFLTPQEVAKTVRILSRGNLLQTGCLQADFEDKVQTMSKDAMKSASCE
jgi:hypothetical protein